MTAHPDDFELAAFLAGGLPAAQAGSVAGHLDGCPLCRAAAERLTAVPADVSASLVLAVGTPPPGDWFPAAAAAPGYSDFRELGRGGGGVVYAARDAGGRPVAVKFLRGVAFASRAERAWFLAEARTAAGLRHPNIVGVLEVGGADAVPYYVMEYVAGESLAARLAGTPLAPRAAASLLRAVCEAVEVAHRAGVVHRDLKPGNVLLAAGPDPLAAPRVTDSGLAKRAGASEFATPSRAVLGTPAYMASEQAFGRSGRVGPPADIYSLGAILYEMLTGRPPFKGETPYETLLQVRSHPLVWPRRLRPGVPRPLEAVCLKCLERHPGHRYPTAAGLADDLTRFLDGAGVRARHPGPVRRLARWARANPPAARLAALLAAGAAAAFVALSALGLHADGQRRQARAAAGSAHASRVAARRALTLYAANATRLYRGPAAITPAERADLTKNDRKQ